MPNRVTKEVIGGVSVLRCNGNNQSSVRHGQYASEVQEVRSAGLKRAPRWVQAKAQAAAGRRGPQTKAWKEMIAWRDQRSGSTPYSTST